MTKEIATIQPSNYAVCNMPAKDLAEIIREAAGESGFTSKDLDRVKIPSGGGVAWEIPSLSGVDTAKELVGVIIHHQDARAYWKQGIEEAGGNQPPDCSSSDGRNGLGTPGGSCTTCPLAAFGSDSKGNGQACKAAKILYMVTQETLLPIAVVMAPTSIKPLRQYLIRLASRGLRPSSVVTSITLEKTKNADGITYAKAVPAMKEALPPEQASAIAKYAETFRAAMGKVNAIHADDVNAS